MKIKDSENDQYGTYITGITYSLVVITIFLIIIYVIKEDWLDSFALYFVAIILGIIFFISGLKNVEEKNLGFLTKFGRRNFDELYSEGWWWIFPVWKFNQKTNFDIMNKSEKLNYTFITKDEIPLDITLSYYWYLKNPKDIDNKPHTSFINDTLQHEIGKYIRSSNAVDLLTDTDISYNVLRNFLKSSGDNIGITISDVFPNFNYESQYLSVVRNYQEKYKELKYILNKALLDQSIEQNKIAIYTNQLLELIKNNNFSNSEALSFLKIYKNQTTMNDYSYNINDLNKILENTITILNK